MRRLLVAVSATALLAAPAAAVGAGGKGHHRHHRSAAARYLEHQARKSCNTERKALGRDAFRAKYGTPHAFRKCVRAYKKAHRDEVRAAFRACRTERRADRAAFRTKYGTPHAFRNCVNAKLAPATTT